MLHGLCRMHSDLAAFPIEVAIAQAIAQSIVFWLSQFLGFLLCFVV